MVNLTFKELFHDKGKFFLILGGLIASMLMMHFGMAMFNGTLKESTLVIDQCESDAWIAQEYRDDVLSDSFIPDETFQEINQLKCVESAEKLIYNFAGFEYNKDIFTVMTYGYDISSNNLGPWEIVEGKVEDIEEEGKIILDISVKRKHANIKRGDTIKINDIEVEIAGFCQNAKWFMSPIAFMSLETAEEVMFMENKTSFIVINLKEGYSFSDLSEKVQDLDDISLYTPEEIRNNTRDFMIFESGMGMGIGIMVIMGLFVGFLIIILTVYSSIKEKTPEFGTLKALGADKNFIRRMLIGQVLTYITISYFLGMGIALAFGTLVKNFAMMPFFFEEISTILLYLISLSLGVIAGLMGVRGVEKIDPAIVFKS